MSPITCFEQITAWLAEAGIPFTVQHHAPTYTSADSAQARGDALALGGKALVMKVNQTFAVFVISAAQRTSAKKIKTQLGVKKIRFATHEELHTLTGLVPGAVPPFGRPLFDLALYVDHSITQNQHIAFNAGSLTDSILMKTSDYLHIAQPTIFDFAG